MLSLSKNIKISNPLHHIFSLLLFGTLFIRECHYSCFVSFINKLQNFTYVHSFQYFDTWLNPSHPFHPLSNLVTFFARVHVVGDFCHITCLSNPFYDTQYLVPRKTCKFQLSQNLTKFDVVTRFRETILTMKSVSSSKI